MFVLLGLIIGFLAAIPVGPVNVFVISQTLKRDFFHGFLAGLTAAVLDFSYCLVAVMGFFQVAVNLSLLLPIMKVVAALLLIAISLRLIKQSQNPEEPKPPNKIASTSPRPIIGAFLLYVSNPIIYAFWLGVAGTVTAHHWVTNKGGPPILFSLACGLGSILWYLILVRYFSKHQERYRPRTFGFLLRVLAVILLAFAGYTLLTLVI